MTQEEIFKKITDVIVAKLEVKAEDVKMESEFGNDLGADSPPWQWRWGFR